MKEEMKLIRAFVTGFSNEIRYMGAKFVQHILPNAELCDGYKGGPLVNIADKTVVGIHVLHLEKT